MGEHIGIMLAALQHALHVGVYRHRPRAARSTFIPVRIESRPGRFAH